MCGDVGHPMAKIPVELQPYCDATGLLLGHGYNTETQKGSPEPSGYVNTYGCHRYTTASTNQGNITEAKVRPPE